MGSASFGHFQRLIVAVNVTGDRNARKTSHRPPRRGAKLLPISEWQYKYNEYDTLAMAQDFHVPSRW